MTLPKENDSVLIVLDNEISNKDIIDFISAIKKPLTNGEQLKIILTKEWETREYARRVLIGMSEYIYLSVYIYIFTLFVIFSIKLRISF